MRAIQEAKRLALEMGVSFEKELAFHLAHGVVVSNDNRFGMARPILLQSPDEVVDNPDCWLVTCVVGKDCLPWFWTALPYQLPYIAWRRHHDPTNRLRCYNSTTFQKLLLKKRNTP